MLKIVIMHIGIIHVQEDCGDSDDQNDEGQYRVHNSNNVVKVFLYGINLINASVGGIEQLKKYARCIKCTAKILSDQDDPDVGECVRCGM